MNWPSIQKSSIDNARIGARFALAAYTDQARERHNLTANISSNKGRIKPFDNGSASGIVAISPDDMLVIGIAGTDDADDLRHDGDWFGQGLGDWGQMHKIPVARDCKGCETTAGFLAYTQLVYHGLEAILEFMDFDPRDAMGCWMFGHSLGGSCVTLLQCCEPYNHSHIITYGCPKTFRKGTTMPQRLRTAVWHYTDSITYGPPGCQSSDAENIIVRRKGSFRSKIPAQYKPLVAAYVVGSWVANVVGSIASRFGYRSKRKLFASHSMEGYVANLKTESD